MAYAYIFSFFFFFNDTATPEIYPLSLHDALPISAPPRAVPGAAPAAGAPAAVSHHHDRVVPPDGGGPGGAPPVPRRQDDRVGIRALHPGPDPADTQDPGGPGTRRARTRRVRAQRHGGVLRGAAPGVRLHRARLGAVLRLPLREAADHLRRRVAPQADDRAVEHVRAGAHRPPREGDAHGTGHDPAMVLRARRPAPFRNRAAARTRDQ